MSGRPSQQTRTPSPQTDKRHTNRMSTATRFARFWESRKVLETLVRRDLRVRYARSWLGYLWTLIDPLAMGLVYWFVFGKLMHRGGADIGFPYIVFLMAAMLPWNWFNQSINETSRALYAERLLVRSTNIPRELWVIRVVIAKGIEFLLSLPILAVFIVFYMIQGEQTLNWNLVWILPALLIQFVLLVGMGLVMAPVTALVDDFARLVRIALRMLFYFTPIVYSLDLVDERAPWAAPYMLLNPLVGVTDMFRIGLTPSSHYEPLWHAWVVAAAIALAWLAFGMWVFRKLEPAVLKEI